MREHPPVERVDPLALIEAARGEIASTGNVDSEHDDLNRIRDRFVAGDLDAEGVRKALWDLRESRNAR